MCATLSFGQFLTAVCVMLVFTIVFLSIHCFIYFTLDRALRTELRSQTKQSTPTSRAGSRNNSQMMHPPSSKPLSKRFIARFKSRSITIVVALFFILVFLFSFVTLIVWAVDDLSQPMPAVMALLGHQALELIYISLYAHMFVKALGIVISVSLPFFAQSEAVVLNQAVSSRCTCSRKGCTRKLVCFLYYFWFILAVVMGLTFVLIDQFLDISSSLFFGVSLFFHLLLLVTGLGSYFVIRTTLNSMHEESKASTGSPELLSPVLFVYGKQNEVFFQYLPRLVPEHDGSSRG
jgi:hypothetical protein